MHIKYQEDYARYAFPKYLYYTVSFESGTETQDMNPPQIKSGWFKILTTEMC
jgi:hypothetical protein